MGAIEFVIQIILVVAVVFAALGIANTGWSAIKNIPKYLGLGEDIGIDDPNVKFSANISPTLKHEIKLLSTVFRNEDRYNCIKGVRFSDVSVFDGISTHFKDLENGFFVEFLSRGERIKQEGSIRVKNNDICIFDGEMSQSRFEEFYSNCLAEVDNSETCDEFLRTNTDDVIINPSFKKLQHDISDTEYDLVYSFDDLRDDLIPRRTYYVFNLQTKEEKAVCLLRGNIGQFGVDDRSSVFERITEALASDSKLACDDCTYYMATNQGCGGFTEKSLCEAQRCGLNCIWTDNSCQEV